MSLAGSALLFLGRPLRRFTGGADSSASVVGGAGVASVATASALFFNVFLRVVRLFLGFLLDSAGVSVSVIGFWASIEPDVV